MSPLATYNNGDIIAYFENNASYNQNPKKMAGKFDFQPYPAIISPHTMQQRSEERGANEARSKIAAQ